MCPVESSRILLLLFPSAELPVAVIKDSFGLNVVDWRRERRVRVPGIRESSRSVFVIAERTVRTS